MSAPTGHVLPVDAMLSIVEAEQRHHVRFVVMTQRQYSDLVTSLASLDQAPDSLTDCATLLSLHADIVASARAALSLPDRPARRPR